ncbi:MAG TPA: hypothetical protein VM095_03405 [Pyrinomonadaceae bacterium]|nr:hypothetical protein [Pyrinomonadaceae bacterium]
MIIINEVKQTCAASPSQWEGMGEEGHLILVRYRWGYLSIEKDNEEIWGKQLGGRLDGSLTYEELKQATEDFIVWPEAFSSN